MRETTLDLTVLDEKRFAKLNKKEQDKILAELEEFLFGATRLDRYKTYGFLLRAITEWRRFRGIGINGKSNTTRSTFGLGEVSAFSADLEKSKQKKTRD